MIEFTDKSGHLIKIKIVSAFGEQDARTQEQALMDVLSKVPASEFMTPPLMSNGPHG